MKERNIKKLEDLMMLMFVIREILKLKIKSDYYD